jgi:hypothetical protein
MGIGRDEARHLGQANPHLSKYVILNSFQDPSLRIIRSMPERAHHASHSSMIVASGGSVTRATPPAAVTRPRLPLPLPP